MHLNLIMRFLCIKSGKKQQMESNFHSIGNAVGSVNSAIMLGRTDRMEV